MPKDQSSDGPRPDGPGACCRTFGTLLEAIVVDLRAGTAWNAHTVRQAVLQIWTLEAQASALSQ